MSATGAAEWGGRRAQSGATLLGPTELRRRRRALGLTQAELAVRLAVSANTVARWERGELRVGQPRQVERILARLERTSRLVPNPLAGEPTARRIDRARVASPNPIRERPRHHSQVFGTERLRAGHLTLLVGRERELAILREQLCAAADGRGRLALIGGQAGIGKSALAAALCSEAAAQGAHVLTGHAYDLTDTPPYGLWVELVRGWPTTSDPPTLADLLGSGARGRPGGSQALIPAAISDALAAAATEDLLVLLLEDLQWADPASLDVLRVVVRRQQELRLLVLGTYRSDELGRDHPLHALLPLLVREAEAVRLSLRPLQHEAVATLVFARYPLPAADATRLVSYLQRHGEGNPFYIGELLRALEEDDLLRRTPDGWALAPLDQVPVPLLIRQVVDGRLARLGSPVRDLLAVAAVVGQEVPLPLLAAVAGSPEEALLPAIERAVDAGVLVETPDGLRVRFAHAIIRSALYESLLAARRRTWHARVADMLLAAAHPDPDAVAYHLRQAGDERAADWLLEASERAERAYALLTAADRLVLAVPLLEQRGAGPAELGWLHFRTAQLRRFAEPPRALAELDVAAQLAQEAGDRVLGAHVLADRGWLFCSAGELGRGIRELAVGSAALEQLAGDDGSLPGPAFATRYHRPSTRVGFLTLVGRFDEALHLGRRYLSQPVEPPEVRLTCHGNTAIGLIGASAALGDPTAAEEMLALTRDVYRQVAAHVLLGWLGVQAMNWLLLPYAADRRQEWWPIVLEAEDAWERASGAMLDHPPGILHLPLLFTDGAWGQLRTLAETARSSSVLYWWKPYATSFLCQLDLAQGAHDDASALVREMLPDGPASEPGDVYFYPALALQRAAATLALDTGDLPTAAAWLTAHDRWLAWSGAVLGQAEGHLAWAGYYQAAGERAEVRQRALAALDRASQPRQPRSLLAAHRVLGQLAIDAGQRAEATTQLGVALHLAEACGAPYERVLVRLAQAELASAQGRAEAAAPLLDEVRALCASLGARPALARADALAARLPARVTRGVPFPAGLSAREVEVLRLVAAGLTNAQAAEALTLSPRTVAQHLRSIYNKLGVASRSAATRFALEHHLA